MGVLVLMNLRKIQTFFQFVHIFVVVPDQRGELFIAVLNI